MENYIVLIHAGVAVIFTFYLIVRLFISLFGLRNKDYQNLMRVKFRKPDWIFIVAIGITGIYPIVVLAQIELYHLIKLILFGFVIWSSRYATNLNFAGVSLVALLIMVWSGYSSFSDAPKFPKMAGTFEKQYPEVASLTELEKGEAIFTNLCIQCHGNDGKKRRFQAADLTQSQLTLEERIEIITKGSPLTVMKSFVKDLSSDEIHAVAKYASEFKQK